MNPLAAAARRLVRPICRLVERAVAGHADERAEMRLRPPSVRVVDIGDVTIEVPPAPEWTPDESLPEGERALLRDCHGRDFSRWRAQLWNDLDVAQTITRWEAPR